MRKLNKPLLRRLARKLRRLRHEEHYNQSKLVNKTECGTAACIAGHAAIMSGLPLRFRDNGYPLVSTLEILRTATNALGLSEQSADRLFISDPSGKVCGCNDCMAKAWPAPFRERWEQANPDGPAKQRPSRVAADFLDAIADGTVKL